MSFLRLPRYARADCAARAAIAIYKPPDVRPILEAYSGKDTPIEYAKKEAEAEKKLGADAYKTRDFDNAIAHFQKAWDIYPKDITFLTNLAGE